MLLRHSPPKISFVIYIPQGTYPQHMAHEDVLWLLSYMSDGRFTVSEQERPVAV